MNDLHPFVEWLAAALLLVAAVFSLVGAIGLVRLPDFFMRLHAPTKASTLGVGGVLLASMVVALGQGRIGFAELLITLFVFRHGTGLSQSDGPGRAAPARAQPRRAANRRRA